MKKLGFLIMAATLAAAGLSPAPALADPPILAVKPSQMDPSIREFDDSHLIIPARRPDAPLAIFLTGTGGRPQGMMRLLSTMWNQGYAVIGLEYRDAPAINQICPHSQDPDCYGSFRRMRLHGGGPIMGFSDTAADSIEGRLTALLTALQRERPREGWGRHLKNGAPDWAHILVSGQSMGAGMAAYLAKEVLVGRVVLFSSPWDFTPSTNQLSPWLSQPSATPPARWYAAYNAREATAAVLVRSYQALAIPPDHIRVFRLDLPPEIAKANWSNPYHAVCTVDVRYTDDWRFLFGTPEQFRQIAGI